jgi:hypothetical protein
MGDSGSKEPRVAFSQPNWQVQGDVYNTAGDLILSKESSRGDFVKALEDLKAEIGKLNDLPAGQREEIHGDLNAAIQEAKSEAPSKPTLVNRLNTVKAALESMKDTVQGAWNVAKTVTSVVGWAAAFFA